MLFGLDVHVFYNGKTSFVFLRCTFAFICYICFKQIVVVVVWLLLLLLLNYDLDKTYNVTSLMCYLFLYGTFLSVIHRVKGITEKTKRILYLLLCTNQ